MVWPTHHRDAQNYYDLEKINVEWSAQYNYYDLEKINVEWSGTQLKLCAQGLGNVYEQKINVVVSFRPKLCAQGLGQNVVVSSRPK